MILSNEKKLGKGKVKKTSQELRMLSSVTLYCQVTMIVLIEFLNFQKGQQFHKAS